MFLHLEALMHKVIPSEPNLCK